ncbi:hypothetical protein PPERSA_00205 [Pseudocohnilembus persalinus]|uniref:Uncharacterized protein n=1 Tax=Pseudocohnilembus persalinus TaxID=266149 RepID=A0A0V0QQB9_PSEPJ|nr:hypothetical protein PPERSA_00205 [Pseudocohnilembus persalinus]|eukprot:KRX04436.1 hypothetical protein PPERSA_00205 [Pseudocohnilembus persalinus]
MGQPQKFSHYNNIQPIDVYKKVSPELTNLILKNNKYKSKKNISKLKKQLKNKNQAQVKSIIKKINSQIKIEKIDEDFIIAREQYRKKENLEAIPVPLLSENFQQALIIKKREKLQQIMLKQ